MPNSWFQEALLGSALLLLTSLLKCHSGLEVKCPTGFRKVLDFFLVCSKCAVIPKKYSRARSSFRKQNWTQSLGARSSRRHKSWQRPGLPEIALECQPPPPVPTNRHLESREASLASISSGASTPPPTWAMTTRFYYSSLLSTQLSRTKGQDFDTLLLKGHRVLVETIK